MASSGRVNGSHVTIGGYGGSYIFVDWHITSQSENGNYSNISWYCDFHFQGADAQLDNGNAKLSGTRWSDGGRVHNYGGNFSTRNIRLASGSFRRYHTSSGSQTMGVSTRISVYGSGTSSGSHTYTLPSLYQGISVSGPSFSSIQENSVNVKVTTNRTADLLQLSVDGASWKTYYSGNFTSKTVTVTGLSAGHSHTVRARARRDSNHNYGYTGTSSFTTQAEISYDSIEFENITDVSFDVHVKTSRTATYMDLNIDNKGWVRYYTGSFTDATVTVGSQTEPLRSGIPHTVNVRVNCAGNNYLLDSGNKTVETLNQNRFFQFFRF